MYLLKMIFSQGINSRVQNKATDILIDNFAQREYFLKEVVNVELLITPEDEKLNQKYKEHFERIEKLLKHLILDDLDYLLLHNFEKEKYRNRVKDATIVIKNVRSTLKREFNDKNKEERMAVIRKSQNILREFGVHKLAIDCMKEIYFRRNEHYALFQAILTFLEHF
jgi:diketogulonate reductase-like aldo/keto reductase